MIHDGYYELSNSGRVHKASTLDEEPQATLLGVGEIVFPGEKHTDSLSNTNGHPSEHNK